MQTSVRAVTVAVRGTSCSSAISPKPSPRPQRRDAVAGRDDVDLAVGDHEETIAVARPARITSVPAGSASGSSARASDSRVAGGSGFEQRHRAQQRDLDDRDGRVPVDVEQAAPGDAARASGRIAPTPMKAAGAPPSATSAGASSEPTA